MPQALAIGIDYQTFLKLNPTRLESFIKADKLKREMEDTQAWLQGQYMYIAFSTVMANFGAGLGGKNGDAEYIDMPIHLKKEQREKEIIDMQNVDLMRERLINQLNNMAIASGNTKLVNENEV